MSKIRRLASKACGIILVCAAGIHLSGALFPVANAQVPATAAETPPSLAAFQAVVDPVVRALVASGARNVYLGGGSARAILDHIVRGHAIAMRDLDLVIDFPEISIEAVRAIGTKIETLGLRAEAAAPAPRGNPRLPEPERYQYIAAYYLGLKGLGYEWDLSFFPKSEDIALSGILSSDMIRIDLKLATLVDLLRQVRSLGYAEARHRRLVVDPENGYADWTSGQLRVVNSTDLEGDPSLTSVRLLRMYRSRGHPDLPPRLKRRLKAAIAAQNRLHRLPGDEAFGRRRIPRAIRKVLLEPDRAFAVRWMAEMGIVGKWSPAVQAAILSHPEADWAKYMRGAPERIWADFEIVADPASGCARRLKPDLVIDELEPPVPGYSPKANHNDHQ